MQYATLEKGVKNSIHISIQNNIKDFFEANDFDIDKLDLDFYYECWFTDSQQGRKSSWHERLDSDPTPKFIEELRIIFNAKVEKYYNKPALYQDNIDYLVSLADKFYVNIDTNKLKCYGYNRYMYIKLKKLRDEATTPRQMKYARDLCKQVNNEELEEKYYTKEEISSVIQSLLSKKTVKNKYK